MHMFFFITQTEPVLLDMHDSVHAGVAQLARCHDTGVHRDLRTARPNTQQPIGRLKTSLLFP